MKGSVLVIHGCVEIDARHAFHVIGCACGRNASARPPLGRVQREIDGRTDATHVRTFTVRVSVPFWFIRHKLPVGPTARHADGNTVFVENAGSHLVHASVNRNHIIRQRTEPTVRLVRTTRCFIVTRKSLVEQTENIHHFVCSFCVCVSMRRDKT